MMIKNINKTGQIVCYSQKDVVVIKNQSNLSECDFEIFNMKGLSVAKGRLVDSIEMNLKYEGNYLIIVSNLFTYYVKKIMIKI